MTAVSNTSRVAELRARRKAMGFIRREYYATVAEHESIKNHLKDKREENARK